MPPASPGRKPASVIPMALKMRPTGLGHGVYKDNVDYGVFCGGWCIGRIYETRTGPADLRCFSRSTLPASQGTCGPRKVATFETAKAEFEACWEQWKLWAGMEETETRPRHIQTVRHSFKSRLAQKSE